MLVPNIDRILVKRIDIEGNSVGSTVIIPGQLTAGENLFYGEVVHAGDTKFKKGQKVYYSEYSVAAIKDLGAIQKGTKSYYSNADMLFIVAQDDVMAYEDGEDE